MSGELFKRATRLTLVKPDGLTGLSSTRFEIVDLQMKFSIEKTLKSEPNTCTVSVTNLSQQARAEFQKKPLAVFLDVGFAGDLKRIFTGDLRYAASKKNDSEWETTFELADGDRAYRYGRTNQSFRPKIKADTVLERLAKDMGLLKPEQTTVPKQFEGGYSAHGQCSKELTRLLKPHGLDWSVQDGRLQILSADQVRDLAPFVISSNALDGTGLIGSPEFGSPEKGKKQPNLTFQTLLNPLLYPGGLVQLDSLDIKGFFKLVRVTHSGDTFGEARTECEAQAFKI